jgi:hypothetical protein
MAAMGERADELVAAVNPVGKDMAQLGEPASQSLQKRYRSMAILNVGGMNVDGEQKAIGVGDDMPLAPVDTFAGIVASGAAGLGRRCALTVEDRCRRLGLRPSFRRACRTSAVTIFCHRQGTPLAARGQNVKNRLQNRAQIHFPRPAQSASRRKSARDQRPFRISHVACAVHCVDTPHE